MSIDKIPACVTTPKLPSHNFFPSPFRNLTRIKLSRLSTVYTSLRNLFAMGVETKFRAFVDLFSNYPKTQDNLKLDDKMEKDKDKERPRKG